VSGGETPCSLGARGVRETAVRASERVCTVHWSEEGGSKGVLFESSWVNLDAKARRRNASASESPDGTTSSEFLIDVCRP